MGDSRKYEPLERLRVLRSTEDHSANFVERGLVGFTEAEQGEEATQESIDAYVTYMHHRLPGRVKVVSRVGRDVHASCGMFAGPPVSETRAERVPGDRSDLETRAAEVAAQQATSDPR